MKSSNENEIVLNSNKKEPKKKFIGTLDNVLFTLSAVFVLDSLGLSTSFGWQAIIWWAILGFVYFLPYGLITAELGTTYSSEGGGIYKWVESAYGKKAGARTTWFYWINVAFWMPAVYLVLIDSMVFAIRPELLNNSWYIWIEVSSAILITWLTVMINQLKLENIKWLPNISSMIKLSIVVIMLVSMTIFLAQGNSIQTDIDNPDYGIKPNFGLSIGIFGIIIYNLCGFELSSNASENMKDVKKDVPKSIAISGLTIIFAYIIAVIPILIMVNVDDEIYQDQNYVYAIILAIDALSWKALTIFTAVLLSLTLIGNMLTWTLGANLAALEGSKNKQLPKKWGNTNKNGSPKVINIYLGIISTLTILIAGVLTFFSGNANLWYIIFSFSLLVFFIPYLFIFASFIKLRKSDDRERVFSAGPNWLAKFFGYLCFVIVIVASLAQIFNIEIVNGIISIQPADGMGGWWGIFITFFFLIVSWLIGDYLIYLANKENNSSNDQQNNNLKERKKELFKFQLFKIKNRNWLFYKQIKMKGINQY